MKHIVNKKERLEYLEEMIPLCESYLERIITHKQEFRAEFENDRNNIIPLSQLDEYIDSGIEYYTKELETKKKEIKSLKEELHIIT